MKKSPDSEKGTNRQLSLRMSPYTFARLARAAEREKRSLNQQAVLFIERCVHTHKKAKGRAATSI